jgi:hypothetical protein
MAILEINLEKPAVIEEYQHPEKRGKSTSRTGTKSKSSGGNKGKLVGLLAVLVGVTVMAWKLRGRGGTEQADFDETSESETEGEYDHGPDPEIGGDKKYEVKRKVKSKVSGALGIAVVAIGLAVVAALRKARK